MDKEVPLVMGTHISVGSYNNNVAIIFGNKVKLSMIKGSRNTNIRFNGQCIVGFTYDFRSSFQVEYS